MSAGLASACHSEGNVLVHNLGTALCNTAGPGERISLLPSSLRKILLQPNKAPSSTQTTLAVCSFTDG